MNGHRLSALSVSLSLAISILFETVRAFSMFSKVNTCHEVDPWTDLHQGA